MKYFTPPLLLLFCALSAFADDKWSSKIVKASLLFHDDVSGKCGYPHVLNVILRLDNTGDSDLSWYANSCTGIEAELLNPTGKPAQQPPSASSIASNYYYYRLPFGSRLDWLISHGGVSIAEDAKDKYVLVVGRQGWLIPIANAESYTLRVRFRGWNGQAPGSDMPKEFRELGLKLLLDLPPTKIKVTPTIEQGADGKTPEAPQPPH